MFGIIRGDVRYTYLSQMLCDSILSNELKDFYGIDQLILPFKGIDESYQISQSNINLLDILKMNRIKTIFTGNANKELIELCHNHKIQLFEMLKDPTFVMSNAFLTAKGLLYHLHHGTKDISEYKILLLGYGNIAFYLAKLFCLLQVDFHIFTPKEEEEKYARLEGYTLKDEVDSSYDMIINTIPKNLEFKYEVLKDTKIIDVASPPYGFDLLQIQAHGIDYEIHSSIPSKFAPKTAALIIKKYIENQGLS